MKMERLKITQSQMNLILAGVEHGVRQCENGKNLQAAMVSVFELYEVAKPEREKLVGGVS